MVTAITMDMCLEAGRKNLWPWIGVWKLACDSYGHGQVSGN